jgi:hypothetical protein
MRAWKDARGKRLKVQPSLTCNRTGDFYSLQGSTGVDLGTPKCLDAASSKNFICPTYPIPNPPIGKQWFVGTFLLIHYKNTLRHFYFNFL